MKTDTEILTELLDVYKKAMETEPFRMTLYFGAIQKALDRAQEQRLIQTGDDNLTLSILGPFKKYLNTEGYTHLPPDGVLKPALAEAISLTRLHISDEMPDMFEMLAVRVVAVCRIMKGDQFEKACLLPEAQVGEVAIKFEGHQVVDATRAK